MSIEFNDRLRFVEASGGAREIGRQLGGFGAEAVHRHLIRSASWAHVMAHRHDARVQGMAAQVRGRLPAIFEELVGLAEGLELPFEDVFAWNCRGDIWAMAPDGCTTVQIPGNRITIAHNEDGDPGFRGSCGLLRASPARGLGFTSFVYPGSIPGHTFAANDAGLVMTVNNIRSLAPGDGLPRMALARAVLDCGNLDQAVALIADSPRAGAFHVTLAQAGDRRLFGVEFTGARCSVREIQAPTLHANHLVHANMTDEPQVVTDSSGSRQRRGDSLMVGTMGESDALAVLRDADGEGLPIRRDDPHDPDGENTLATAIFSIDHGGLDWAVHDGSSELARFHRRGPRQAA